MTDKNLEWQIALTALCTAIVCVALAAVAVAAVFFGWGCAA